MVIYCVKLDHALYSINYGKGRVLLFSETFEINPTTWHQARAVSLAIWQLPHPQLSFDQALRTFWWQVSTKMTTKDRKQKQTDTSALLSILAMSISLALARLRAQPVRYGQVAWSQYHKTTIHGAHIRTFPFSWPRKIQKTSLNVTVSIFIRYRKSRIFCV